MAVVIKKKEIIAETEHTSPTKHVTTEKQVLGEIKSVNPFATVGFTGSFTKNLGNYESAKIQVSLVFPVEISPDAVKEQNDLALDSAFTYASEWVDGKIKEVLESYKKD